MLNNSCYSQVNEDDGRENLFLQIDGQPSLRLLLSFASLTNSVGGSQTKKAEALLELIRLHCLLI